MQRARFGPAAEAFERAEAADDLSREDVVDLLDARAMLYLATGEAGLLEEAVQALASLDPEHRFGREAPPELAEAFAQAVSRAGGPLEVTVAARGREGGVAVEARVEGDPGGLVRELRILARSAGGSFRLIADGLVPASAGQRVELYVEAVGPGGAVLARQGSADAPITSEPALAGAAAPIRARDAEGGGVSAWVWIGIGGALAVAGGVVALLLLGGGGASGTQPDSPLVIGF